MHIPFITFYFLPMNLSKLLSAVILASGMLAMSSAFSEPVYKIQVPANGLAVSSTATPPPPPQQHTFYPANGEVFTIPAGATAITYDIYINAVNGRASYTLYRGDTYVTGSVCGCSATWNTFRENYLVPGHSYRLVVAEGKLSPGSVLKYTK